MTWNQAYKVQIRLFLTGLWLRLSGHKVFSFQKCGQRTSHIFIMKTRLLSRERALIFTLLSLSQMIPYTNSVLDETEMSVYIRLTKRLRSAPFVIKLLVGYIYFLHACVCDNLEFLFSNMAAITRIKITRKSKFFVGIRTFDCNFPTSN